MSDATSILHLTQAALGSLVYSYGRELKSKSPWLSRHQGGLPLPPDVQRTGHHGVTPLVRWHLELLKDCFHHGLAIDVDETYEVRVVGGTLVRTPPSCFNV